MVMAYVRWQYRQFSALYPGAASMLYLHGGSLLGPKISKRHTAFCAIATGFASALLVYLVLIFDDLCLQSDQNMFRRVLHMSMYYTAAFCLSPVPLTISDHAHICSNSICEICCRFVVQQMHDRSTTNLTNGV